MMSAKRIKWWTPLNTGLEATRVDLVRSIALQSTFLFVCSTTRQCGHIVWVLILYLYLLTLIQLLLIKQSADVVCLCFQLLKNRRSYLLIMHTCFFYNSHYLGHIQLDDFRINYLWDLALIFSSEMRKIGVGTIQSNK